MIGALSLIESKWGRIAVETGLTAILIALAALYCYEKGKRAGAEEVKQSFEQQLAKQEQAAEARLEAVQKTFQPALDAAAAERQQANQERAADLAILADLVTKGQQGQSTVAGLKDSELHDYIVGLLNKRAPGDNTKGFLSSEERSLADCVTQYPICQKELAGKDSEIVAADKQTDSADKTADALKQMSDAQADFIGQLKGLFAQLFNLHPPKYRSWKCLKAWRCGTQKLPVAKAAIP